MNIFEFSLNELAGAMRASELLNTSHNHSLFRVMHFESLHGMCLLLTSLAKRTRILVDAVHLAQLSTRRPALLEPITSRRRGGRAW